MYSIIHSVMCAYIHTRVRWELSWYGMLVFASWISCEQNGMKNIALIDVGCYRCVRNKFNMFGHVRHDKSIGWSSCQCSSDTSESVQAELHLYSIYLALLHNPNTCEECLIPG